jgi:hypothetical protein
MVETSLGTGSLYAAFIRDGNQNGPLLVARPEPEASVSQRALPAGVTVATIACKHLREIISALKPQPLRPNLRKEKGFAAAAGTIRLSAPMRRMTAELKS